MEVSVGVESSKGRVKGSGGGLGRKGECRGDRQKGEGEVRRGQVRAEGGKKGGGEGGGDMGGGWEGSRGAGVRVERGGSRARGEGG